MQHRHGAPGWRAPLLEIALLLAALGAGTFVVTGQQPPQIFRSVSDLVVLHVNVFNGRSDAVPNLAESAFHVFEDDKPQTLSFFSNEDVPVAVGLVLDNSSSMLRRRNMVVAGAAAFAESSHPEDEVFTLLFNEEVRYGLPDTALFSRNRWQVLASVHRYPPGGKTAIHDAVVAGLEHLEEASHQKRVLVVLSDGEDNASRHSDEDMLQKAARGSALIYPVSTADLDPGVGNHRLLKKLAEVSGGIAYRPRTEADVVKAFTEIAGNIRRGYSLGYVPTNTTRDGRYRRLKVSVYAPGMKNLKVSVRDGYLAPSHAESQ